MKPGFTLQSPDPRIVFEDTHLKGRGLLPKRANELVVLENQNQNQSLSSEENGSAHLALRIGAPIDSHCPRLLCFKFSGVKPPWPVVTAYVVQQKLPYGSSSLRSSLLNIRFTTKLLPVKGDGSENQLSILLWFEASGFQPP